MTAIPLSLHNRHGEIVAVAWIDSADEHLAKYGWCRGTNGYVFRRLGRTMRLLHREILGLTKGDGLEGDHINGNPLDNRRRNLRVATRAQNCQNMPPAGGSSPHRGVSWHKGAKKWRVQFKIDGQAYHLGLFDTETAAADAAQDFRADRMPFANRG